MDGIIGQLEVYKSGAVKMRIGNGIVYDVRRLPVLSPPFYILLDVGQPLIISLVRL